MPITVWVDADSCPAMVRDYVIKYAEKLSVQVKFVANRDIPKKENQKYEMIIVEQQKDSADSLILENATPSDLVITRDIVFADTLVEKHITAINDRGTVFTAENVKEMKSERDFDMQLVEMGLSKHPRGNGYDKSNFSKFANCFDKTIHQLLKI